MNAAQLHNTTEVLRLKAELARTRVEFPVALQLLFKPMRFKVIYGGRGGTKSWGIAQALVSIAYTRKVRIACLRELQTSIRDSVHRLLTDRIAAMGLYSWFNITDRAIVSKTTGAEFLFKGLRHNASEIKSTEGIDIAWVEEAHDVSRDSWDMLIPTVRNETAALYGAVRPSEIWVSLNPVEATDETYDRFILKPRLDAWVRKINFDENPWFPKVLEAERQHCLRHDPANYDHIWLGGCKIIGEAVVFKGKFVVDAFETDEQNTRFFHGIDFGFSDDPFVMVRCYITGVFPEEELWIDREYFGYGIDLDVIPTHIKRAIPSCKIWPIKADNARPECISLLKRQGFSVQAAEKWPGSVEDGIAHLRAFKMIHIHQSCVRTAQEFRLYSYKVDKRQVPLPVLATGSDHSPDAGRYSLCGHIQKRGVDQVWANL
jgi:phage terminase large subunit